MIREEAIRFLNEQKEFLLKGCFWEETRMNTNEAFDMAIKALEAQKWIPTNERLPEEGKWVLVTVTNHVNIMKRINVDVKGMTFTWENSNGRYVYHDADITAWMPLPEPYNEIFGEESSMQTNTSNTLNALDCISRQAAINALNEEIIKRRIFDGVNDGMLDEFDTESILMGLSPAQPDQKVGKWIDHSDDGYVECPFCGSATNCDDNINELHYCFSCGAKMEG